MSRAMRVVASASAVGAIAVASTSFAAAAHGSGTTKPFLASLHAIKTIGTTVPPNGDVNPYGIAIVGHSAGSLVGGSYLVSNFNAKSNNQGTGTTIVQISPAGKLSVFAQISAASLPGDCPGGVGLTTALGIVPGGYVVVGSLPTTNGQSATAKYGCLIVLNNRGKAVETIAGPNIQGPWDMATVSKGSTTTLFVSNVLNGGAAKGRHTIDNSTVLRIRLQHRGRHAEGRESGRRGGRHPVARRQGSVGDRAHRARARGQRHALRRRHAGEPNHRGSLGDDPQRSAV